MWQKAGLILIGMALGAGGALVVFRWPFTRKAPSDGSPDPKMLHDAAREFLEAVKSNFGSIEEAIKPIAWINSSGKNFIPEGIKQSHANLKALLKRSGRTRTPSRRDLVRTAICFAEEYDPWYRPLTHSESPKITFAEGESKEAQIP